MISALLGDYVEAGAIIAIVILNAVLGIVQDRRAEQAEQLATQARHVELSQDSNFQMDFAEAMIFPEKL